MSDWVEIRNGMGEVIRRIEDGETIDLPGDKIGRMVDGKLVFSTAGKSPELAAALQWPAAQAAARIVAQDMARERLRREGGQPATSQPRVIQQSVPPEQRDAMLKAIQDLKPAVVRIQAGDGYMLVRGPNGMMRVPDPHRRVSVGRTNDLYHPWRRIPHIVWPVAIPLALVVTLTVAVTAVLGLAIVAFVRHMNAAAARLPD